MPFDILICRTQRRLLRMFCFVNPSIHRRSVWRETPKRLLMLRILRQGPNIRPRHVTTNDRKISCADAQNQDASIWFGRCRYTNIVKSSAAMGANHHPSLCDNTTHDVSNNHSRLRNTDRSPVWE
jgi:hypothetical protein